MIAKPQVRIAVQQIERDEVCERAQRRDVGEVGEAVAREAKHAQARAVRGERGGGDAHQAVAREIETLLGEGGREGERDRERKSANA